MKIPSGSNFQQGFLALRELYCFEAHMWLLAPRTIRHRCKDSYYHKNLYYHDEALVLESFISTLLKDSPGLWRNLLEA